MELYVVPNYFPTYKSSDIEHLVSVFLAGGITNCYNWQKEVFNYLRDHDNINPIDLRIYNPRRDHFDIENDSAKEQIEWEYNMINNEATIFSMYFCNSESDQPICMYELGMRLGKLKSMVMCSFKTGLSTIISIEDGYKRANDVIMQTKLAVPELKINLHATPESHAELILKEYYDIRI